MQLPVVVEDDPVIGLSLRLGFRETGDEGLWAKDGERALELAEPEVRPSRFHSLAVLSGGFSPSGLALPSPGEAPGSFAVNLLCKSSSCVMKSPRLGFRSRCSINTLRFL